ncbi:Ribosomal protein L13 [Plasmodiophora brassicae]|uniref:Ribosomal protein L13 n=1 Tax=Plasmodiophora brassicae TaxID=37360 RepID=A0A0G4IS15_PLABS|nr:hypothetical protein PBRA_006116 [Plasmodiophora brassicae]SPQ96173.1 unnamed protein product [Plasmodiophora brassicae]
MGFSIGSKPLRLRKNVVDTVPRAWHLFDATGQVVGRLATRIARLLMGKHKPTWDPRSNYADYCVVLNAEKVVFSGKKWDQKLYRHHTGHPGGLVEIPAKRMRDRHPDRILRKAIWGMLPPTRLRESRMRMLRLVVGSDNPFADKFEGLLPAESEQTEDQPMRLEDQPVPPEVVEYHEKWVARRKQQ